MNTPQINQAIDLTVVFCTRNRAQSLKQTIECLLAGDRSGVAVELVVIDNGGQDETKQVAESFADRIPVRYYLEPRVGKGHSLNRALDEGGLGRIVAALDDDMSPDGDWIKDVIATCDRLPQVDLFSGPVFTIWPPQPIPAWAKECRSHVLGWALSATSTSRNRELRGDSPIRADRWGCGNHFWFRSKVLHQSIRFGHLWVPEPGLFFDCMEKGAKAMFCRTVHAGHRLQPHLLDRAEVQRRAVMIGVTFAQNYLRPYRPTVKLAWHFKHRPFYTRLGILTYLAYFGGLYVLSRFAGSSDRWFERRIHALERFTHYREMLRVASTDSAYRIWAKSSAL
ncbi:MAG TPA: glycosyltransferase family 2 protein [Lacunisphaera sp.]|nr:glycosyltransferase family 2 protein [Lacunisphaera sp.]